MDICGSPDKNPPFVFNNTNFAKGVDPDVLKQFDQNIAPFLRVLMEEIHKKQKLSSPCQQVINKYKDKINFTPCF